MRELVANQGIQAGVGAHGTVYKGKMGKDEYAIKRVDLSRLRQTVMELAILNVFDHPFLLRCSFTPTIRDGYIHMTTQCALSDLNHLSQKPSDAHLQNWTFELVSALNTLHEYRIVHADIKPANILLFADHVKLADFSSARLVREGDRLKHNAITITYRPVEVFLAVSLPEKVYWGFSADIWSLGCTLYEIATQEMLFPFQESTSSDGSDPLCIAKSIKALMTWFPSMHAPDLKRLAQLTVQNTDDKFQKISILDEFKQVSSSSRGEIFAIIRQCLHPDPAKRPSTAKLLQHRGLSHRTTPSFKTTSIQVPNSIKLTTATLQNCRRITEQSGIDYEYFVWLIKCLWEISLETDEIFRCALVLSAAVTGISIHALYNDDLLLRHALEYLRFQPLRV